MQVVKLELSILHSKWLIPTPLPSLPPVSLAEKVNVTELEDVLLPVVMKLLLPLVAENMEVVGGPVSTVHVNDVGEGLMFPTLSSDVIFKV